MAPLPPEAFAATLAGLPGMGPGRLLALLRRWEPAVAWDRVATRSWLSHRDIVAAAGNGAAALADTWVAAARSTDVASVWARHEEAGVGVAALGSAAYPAALAADVEPPAVLFLQGDPSVVAGPRVAIVGTRRCTSYGADVAFELGRDLAAAGVAVVSGLALGIDGAAHAGALSADTAPPIAVVGSGLDVVYPRRHRALWREVERRGVLFSEAPLGSPPERWRFPARNRLLAALADIVVVVESHEAGGALLTVTEAQRRDRPVMAVPGPVRSSASTGTNRLLADGFAPACDASDVLLALGLSPALARSVRDGRQPPDGGDRTVLDALAWQPASFDQLAARTGLALGPLSLALGRLEAGGWLARRGAWYEQVARTES
ncbi:MAG: processing protein [Acidimicrobiaceae bacterium]